MAYNRPYNPDELPRFAEPEQRGGAASAPRPSPPQPQYHQQSPAQQTPPPASRYENRPPPPRPQDPRPQDTRHRTSDTYRGGAPPDPRRLNTTPQAGYGGPSAVPPSAYGATSPPPTGGPRPSPATVLNNRPPAASRPPPSPAPDGVADPSLLPLFRAVDKSGTGQLSERELSAALVNGDWTSFDPHTVRMMIRMFDSDRSGTIGFDEFCGLWSFLASWRTLFDRFDTDRSGTISLEEFSNALVAFRYRLSDRFVDLLFRTYDKRNEGSMSFDLFVQACISLKRMTDVFKRYDEDRDGYITLSFEDFLTEILRQMK